MSERGRENSADVDSQDRLTPKAGVQMRRRNVTLSLLLFHKRRPGCRSGRVRSFDKGSTDDSRA